MTQIKKDIFKTPILIDLPWPIETDRLILQPALPDDGAAVHEAIEETRDELKKWMIWAQKKMTVDEVEQNIREAYARFIRREDMRVHGFEKTPEGLKGQFVLSTGIHRFDWNLRRFEIGYWSRKSAWGKGYVTESTAALTRYAFEVMHARHVAIEHAEGNEGSKRVIEKLGFIKEGILKGALPNCAEDSVYDSHQYSLCNADHLQHINVKWGHRPKEPHRC